MALDQTLLTVTYFGVILLIGLLSSIVSRKLKIPNLLLLIGVGMAAGYIKINGQPLINFPPIFLTSIAVITLAMVVFDSSSKFKFREFDSMSASALKLSLIFLFLNMTILSAITYYIFRPDSILLAVAFAAVVSGTDPSSTLMILAGAKTKLFELLKVEAIINTPLIVLIPFLLIDIIGNVAGDSTLAILSSQALPFAQQFVAGIGTGMIIAFIFFRFMKKYYSATLSPLAMITASLLTYVIAETLGGNGVLAVTTAGLVFGNLYHIKHMKQLQKFGEIFAEVFEIIVFILIGSIIKIPWTFSFLIPASALFLAYLGIRFVAVDLFAKPKEYSLKEKVYMTLNTPKGIAVAVVVFSLATRAVIGLDLILDLILLFMIYSIIISTIITRFTKYFTKMEIKVSEEQ
ncbi:cation:proton antiporter [Candidatus Woesearchaeota archaeon]|nr:cation:proton antiporter [Candidatus Woesearchaeota archaeon]